MEIEIVVPNSPPGPPSPMLFFILGGWSRSVAEVIQHWSGGLERGGVDINSFKFIFPNIGEGVEKGKGGMQRRKKKSPANALEQEGA